MTDNHLHLRKTAVSASDFMARLSRGLRASVPPEETPMAGNIFWYKRRKDNPFVMRMTREIEEKVDAEPTPTVTTQEQRLDEDVANVVAVTDAEKEEFFAGVISLSRELEEVLLREIASVDIAYSIASEDANERLRLIMGDDNLKTEVPSRLMKHLRLCSELKVLETIAGRYKLPQPVVDALLAKYASGADVPQQNSVNRLMEMLAASSRRLDKKVDSLAKEVRGG